MRGTTAELEIVTGPLTQAVAARLRRWRDEDLAVRLWRRDPTLWLPSATSSTGGADLPDVPELTKRLGWLDLPAAMPKLAEEVGPFVEEVKAAGFRQFLLLGMGGSSLAASALAELFDKRHFRVLDSTHPQAVEVMRAWAGRGQTLFLVASKSGTTGEVAALQRFFAQGGAGAGAGAGVPRPGRDAWVAISDAETPLAKQARQERWRRLFIAPAEVGGRFSALSVFGLLPAALMGLDLKRLTDCAQAMASARGASKNSEPHPGLALGALLGEAVLHGRDKLFLVFPPALVGFGGWLEQLLAESTGKRGCGIVPVVQEVAEAVTGLPQAAGAGGGHDRFYLLQRRHADDPAAFDLLKKTMGQQGTPYGELVWHDTPVVAGEFFRWQVATAAAAVALKINPFDQPDVELTKQQTRALLAGRDPCEATPLLTEEGELKLYGANNDVRALSKSSIASALRDFVGQVQATNGDYLALLGFIPPDQPHQRLLKELAARLAPPGVATTCAFGPRYLHATGQLHKGGNDRGFFLIVSEAPPEGDSEAAIPGESYGFGRFIAMQAWGDFLALRQRGRRVCHLVVHGSALAGITALLSTAASAPPRR